MNTYDIEDLYTGQTEQFETEISSEMLDAFRAVTCDTNPLHCDEDYAKNQGFKGRVAYGMLTASFLSTLAGVFLPGERSIIQSVDVRFPRPVYEGDILLVRGTVTEIHESVRQITVAVEIKNQRDESVLKGKMKVGVRNG